MNNNANAATAAVHPIPRITTPFDISLQLPGSKSLALRQLLLAGLASGPSRLRGIPPCEDVDAMLDGLDRFGVRCQWRDNLLHVTPPERLPAGPLRVNLNMSGVSLRFLLAFAALRRDTTWFDGHASLRARPNAELLTALEDLGCEVYSDRGRLPIRVSGPARFARHVSLRADTSSQYLSALMLLAPRLPHGLHITLNGELASRPYVHLTLAEMAGRGVEVHTRDEGDYRIPPAPYMGGDYRIEGDATAATYWAALATLHASTVRLENLGDTTLQGDSAFFEICRRLGAIVTRDVTSTTVTGPRNGLRLLETIDFSAMPDAAPTLMAMAPLLPTATRITGLATLRIKECDRLSAMTTELNRLGVQVEEGADSVVIHPARHFKPVDFDTYHDHRMAMSLAVLGSRVGGCGVRDPGCVGKTYPGFWRDLEKYKP